MGAMNYRLIIFDADGTLRRCTVPGQPCPNRPGEWELIPGVRECLARLDWGQTCVAIASNQAGVALGYLTAQDAIDMLHATGQAAFGAWLPGGIATAHVRICPHRPADGCQCRKPAPGMVLDIMAHYRVAPTRSFDPLDVTVGSVINAICQLAGLEAGEIDTTAQTATLRGYAITRQASARAALEPLLGCRRIALGLSIGQRLLGWGTKTNATRRWRWA